MKRATARIIRELEQLEPTERELVAQATLELTVPAPKFPLKGASYVAAIEGRLAAVQKPGYRGVPAARAMAKARAAVARHRGE